MKTKDQKLLLLNLTMLIFLSEVTVFFWPFIGMFVNAFILTSLLISAVFDKASRNLLACLSIIPAVRLVGFSIPSTDIFLRTALVYCSIFVLCFGYQVCLKIKKTWHRLKHIRDLPLMIIIGVLFGSLEYAFLPKEGFNLGISFSSALLFFLFLGYTEELLFRGLIQNLVEKITKPLYSILFTSILYTFVHINNSLSGTALAFFVSMIVSTVFHRKKNIFLVTALNTTVNLLVFSLANGILVINL